MTSARTVASITAVASVVGLVGYLLRDEGRLVAQHRTPIAATAAPEPEAQAQNPATTQTRIVTPRPAPGAAPASAIDERATMAALRALGPEDAERVLELARDGNARFPNSQDAAERSWSVVKALTTLQRFHEARDEARLTVQRYPGTTWAQDVERHLLVHPLDLPSREEQQELDREEIEIEEFRSTQRAQ